MILLVFYNCQSPSGSARLFALVALQFVRRNSRGAVSCVPCKPAIKQGNQMSHWLQVGLGSANREPRLIT